MYLFEMGLTMKKPAFTMLELVFVIVVIGILAAVTIPRFERDNAGEAAYQIARHIRLAQHHALIYDTLGTAQTYGITFSGLTYTVSDGATPVKDSLTGKNLSNVNMARDFGVTTLNADSNITFDHLGRPNPNQDINITLTADGVNAIISVYRETGYVKVRSIGGTTIP